MREKIVTMVAKNSHQVEGGGTQQSLRNRGVEGHGEKLPQESAVTRMMPELDLRVKQPALPADCQAQAQLCQQGGGGLQTTYKSDNFCPKAGLHKTYEEIGRAFVQAQKEGWRLYKQPKNETHREYVPTDRAEAVNLENSLGDLEDFWWDEEGSCTDLEGNRSPSERHASGG